MKPARRALCVALAFAICLTATGTGAAAENQGNYPPVITTRPSAPARAYIGDTFTIEVEVALPEGRRGELHYRWYYGYAGENGNSIDREEIDFCGIALAGAQSSTLEVTVTEKLSLPQFTSVCFYVAVGYTDSADETAWGNAISDKVTILIAHEYAPRITSQTTEVNKKIPLGGSVTLEVAAELPEGAPGELTYAWYKYDRNSDMPNGIDLSASVATGAEFEIIYVFESLREWRKLLDFFGAEYCPVAINTYIDEDGGTQTVYTYGERVKVVCDIFNEASDPRQVALVGLFTLLAAPVAILVGLLMLMFVPLTAGWSAILAIPMLMSVVMMIAGAVKFFWNLAVGAIKSREISFKSLKSLIGRAIRFVARVIRSAIAFILKLIPSLLRRLFGRKGAASALIKP